MGIGRLMSLKLAGEGCKIAVWDFNQKMAEETASMIKAKGGDAKVYICDVSNADAVRQAATKVLNDYGHVDILFNNAGIVSGKKILDVPDALARKTMDVNTTAHFWTVKSFLPDMLERNSGHIVTIASAAGLVGVSGLADYCASKFGAVGFNDSVRMELHRIGKTGVSTTCVCPYYINTGMFDGVKTRFPLILPILEPEYVANKIIQAVKRKRAALYMPRIIRFTVLGRVFPTGINDFFLDILGVSNSMDQFKGH
jgi:all-trans-retinol dehydrogenase (NAD+)